MTRITEQDDLEGAELMRARDRVLRDFTAAWDARDIERLMRHMTEDCVYLASVGPGLPEPYPLALTGLRRFTLVVRRHPSFGCIVALRSSRRLLSQGASPPAKGAEGCIKPRYQIIASHELQPCTRAHEDAARLPISTLIAYKRFGVLVCHIQSATFLLRSGIR